MTSNQHLDVLLRSMDAAEQSSPPSRERAQSDLMRILSSEPIPAGPNSKTATQPSARTTPNRRRRAVALGGLAAAATAGMLVFPAISGGDPAFATWTAAPGTLIGSERDAAVSDCLSSKQHVGGGMYSTDLSAAKVAIAERRGAWVTVVLSGEDGFEATCTTDATAPWFNKGTIGSIGKPSNAPSLPARGIAATQLGTGSIGNKPISIASGRVGTEVTAMSYINSAKEKVVVTVSKGQFAFWLPGSELQNASDQGVPVDVTYTDGTTESRRLSF